MEKYSLLLTQINEFMKLNGFKKNKDSFFTYSDNNIGLIEFQKNKPTNKFTINVGVYSTSLKIFDNFEVNLKPTISDCHWKIRIGFLMPVNEDFWWEISEKTSVPDLLNDVINVLNEFAIPYL